MLICHKTKPNQTKPNPIYLIYMYKTDLALNNLQWLICNITKPNQIRLERSKHFQTNRPENDSKFVFCFFIYFSSTRVSDFLTSSEGFEWLC